MVKLGAVSVHGDELLLGLAGPNETFGEPLSTVQAYEAVTLTDSDLLCMTMGEVRESQDLANDFLGAVVLRHRQSEHLLSLLGLRRVEERVRGFLGEQLKEASDTLLNTSQTEKRQQIL